jgi:glutaredoxin
MPLNHAGKPIEILTVYSAPWCGDCWRVKQQLKDLHVVYQDFDISDSEEMALFVEKTNHGLRSIPTLLFPDGEILVEPSNQALLVALQAHRLVPITPAIA